MGQLLIVFFAVERRTESLLINVRIFENRAFLVENIILGVAMMAFIRADFASATRDVLYGMAIIMAVAALVALRGLRTPSRSCTGVALFGRGEARVAERLRSLRNAGVSGGTLSPPF
jgi:hypothetical protein